MLFGWLHVLFGWFHALFWLVSCAFLVGFMGCLVCFMCLGWFHVRLTAFRSASAGYLLGTFWVRLPPLRGFLGF